MTYQQYTYIKIMPAFASRGLCRMLQWQLKKRARINLTLSASALPIFTASHPATIVGVHVLNFCVRDGREPDRRRGRIKGGRSVCCGRQKTSLLRQAMFSPGTANGNRCTSQNKKRARINLTLSASALPIFTASHPATIVGANELNFCVRDGNRWTLAAINTDYIIKNFRSQFLLVTHTGFEPMLTA